MTLDDQVLFIKFITQWTHRPSLPAYRYHKDEDETTDCIVREFFDKGIVDTITECDSMVVKFTVSEEAINLIQAHYEFEEL